MMTIERLGRKARRRIDRQWIACSDKSARDLDDFCHSIADSGDLHGDWRGAKPYQRATHGENERCPTGNEKVLHPRFQGMCQCTAKCISSAVGLAAIIGSGGSAFRLVWG